MRKIGGLIAVVLMALLMITGCDNSTANNNNSTDKWEDYYYLQQIQQQMPDTSWYDNDTAATEYTLNTVQQLQGLFTLVNEGTSDFAGKTIYLENKEYDLTGIEVPNEGSSFIGSGKRTDLSSAKVFAGTFDGNGATIKGVELSYLASAGDSVTSGDDEDNTGVGFFGIVKGADADNKAVVKDLVFEGCQLVSTSNTTGIAVGYAENATISGITVKNCEITGPQGVAGVVGRLYEGGEIFDCEVIDSTIHADAATVDYDGTGTGNYNAAGIVGSASYHTNSTGSILIHDNIVDLTGDGEIVATDNYAGGISGNATKIVKIYGNTVKVNSTDQISVTSNPSPYSASTINGTGAATYASADGSVTGNTVVIGGVSNTENDNGRITKN